MLCKLVSRVNHFLPPFNLCHKIFIFHRLNVYNAQHYYLLYDVLVFFFQRRHPDDKLSLNKEHNIQDTNLNSLCIFV